MAMAKTARWIVTTASEPCRTFFISTGSSAMTVAPISQKMLVTTARRQSFVSRHNSPSSAKVERRMFASIFNSGAARDVAGM